MPGAIHFPEQVVRQISRQAFAPVTGRIVGIDTIPPPVMQQFMRVRRLKNKWEADYSGAQQGEGRHTETGFPEIFHQRKFGKWIVSEQRFVQRQVTSRCIEILRSKVSVRVSQIRTGLDPPGRLSVVRELRRNQIDFFLRMLSLPAIDAGRLPLADSSPTRRAWRKPGRQIECDQPVVK